MNEGAPEDIVDFWRGFDPTHPPFIHHKDDKDHLEAGPIFTTLNEYLEGKGLSSESKKTCQTSLFPVPYIGDLAKAKIFILMANPGFSPPDTLELAQDRVFEQFRNDLRKNLRQDFAANEAFPFFYLNPDYRWHNGFIYWEKRFREIAQQLQKNRDFKSYRDALSFMAKHIAVLQLVPYHSAAFPNRATKLLSSQTMQKWACKRLADGNTPAIIARNAKEWSITTHKNIITYKNPECRSARFSLKGEGGKAIYKALFPFCKEYT